MIRNCVITVCILLTNQAINTRLLCFFNKIIVMVKPRHCGKKKREYETYSLKIQSVAYFKISITSIIFMQANNRDYTSHKNH